MPFKEGLDRPSSMLAFHAASSCPCAGRPMREGTSPFPRATSPFWTRAIAVPNVDQAVHSQCFVLITSLCTSRMWAAQAYKVDGPLPSALPIGCVGDALRGHPCTPPVARSSPRQRRGVPRAGRRPGKLAFRMATREEAPRAKGPRGTGNGRSLHNSGARIRPASAGRYNGSSRAVLHPRSVFLLLFSASSAPPRLNPPLLPSSRPPCY